jgi:hypothetical protein
MEEAPFVSSRAFFFAARRKKNIFCVPLPSVAQRHAGTFREPGQLQRLHRELRGVLRGASGQL